MVKFAAFGRTHVLLNSIKALAVAGHRAVMIGTCRPAPEYAAAEEDFESLARELGAEFFVDAAINKPERIEAVRRLGAEVAISVNWPGLIGERMLEEFRHGIINAHGGDLPRYRGNAVPNWAILAGEKKIVITLHQMVAELDAGPIFAQRECPLSEQTYIGDVYRFVAEHTPGMFVAVLADIERGTLRPVAQETRGLAPLRCLPRLPGDSEIDWAVDAQGLARLVRASAEPFAGAFTYLNGCKLVVWRARSESLPFEHRGVPGQVIELRPNGEVTVLTGTDLLVLEQVEHKSSGRRPPAEVIRSTRTRLGLNFSEEIALLKIRVAELEHRLKCSR